LIQAVSSVPTPQLVALMAAPLYRPLCQLFPQFRLPEASFFVLQGRCFKPGASCLPGARLRTASRGTRAASCCPASSSACGSRCSSARGTGGSCHAASNGACSSRCSSARGPGGSFHPAPSGACASCCFPEPPCHAASYSTSAGGTRGSCRTGSSSASASTCFPEPPCHAASYPTSAAETRGRSPTSEGDQGAHARTAERCRSR
jgi:hypothetical protein